MRLCQTYSVIAGMGLIPAITFKVPSFDITICDCILHVSVSALASVAGTRRLGEGLSIDVYDSYLIYSYLII